MSEPKKEFLPSLNQENLIHEKIFSVPFVNGLLFKSSSKISEDSSLSYEFYLQPRIVTPVRREDGKIGQIKNQTVAAKLIYAKTNSNGNIILKLGTKPWIHVNVKPVDCVSIGMQSLLSTNSIRPTFTGLFMSKYFTTTLKTTLFAQPLLTTVGNQFKIYDPTLIESIDLSFMLGTNDLSGGLQLVKRYNKKDPTKSRIAYSALVQKKWSKNMAEAAVVKDPIPTFVWRFQRKINENWAAGTAFTVSSKLTTNAIFSYKAKIGSSKVQGFYNTEGVVQSSFSRKISNTFDFSVSALLNHPQKNYSFGMGFTYE